jgi:hydroxymethylpyrimidine kinase/phosphomethylpyrimidine kinase/thiamine-phosphate diphosphorylase
MKTVLSIAGLDPTGCAGLLLDTQVISQLGAKPLGLATCLTSQTSAGVTEVFPVDERTIKAQLESVFKEHSVDAIKIGLVANQDQALTIFHALSTYAGPVIFDPVFRPTLGANFMGQEEWQGIFRILSPLCTLFTLNKDEYQLCNDEMEGRTWIYTGGDDQGGFADDQFIGPNLQFTMRTKRLARSVRGTGCALTSSIAYAASQGMPPHESAVFAKGVVHKAIRNSSKTNLGEILGPFSKNLDPDDFPAIPNTHLLPAFAPLDFDMGPYPIVSSLQQLQAMKEAGAKIVQLRIKNETTEHLDEIINSAIQLCRGTSCHLFINDHWRLAIKHGAYGIHLGQEDLQLADLRVIQAAGIRLGISTHDYYEAAIAHGLQPSYVALGPIFPTTCKSMKFGPQGMGRIAQWKKMLPYPLVAIGGLKEEHIVPIREIGPNGMAVISDVLGHQNPILKMKSWIRIWNGDAKSK